MVSPRWLLHSVVWDHEFVRLSHAVNRLSWDLDLLDLLASHRLLSDDLCDNLLSALCWNRNLGSNLRNWRFCDGDLLLYDV